MTFLSLWSEELHIEIKGSRAHPDDVEPLAISEPRLGPAERREGLDSLEASRSRERRDLALVAAQSLLFQIDKVTDIHYPIRREVRLDVGRVPMGFRQRLVSGQDLDFCTYPDGSSSNECTVEDQPVVDMSVRVG